MRFCYFLWLVLEVNFFYVARKLCCFIPISLKIESPVELFSCWLHMAPGNSDFMSGFLCQPFQIACSFETAGKTRFSRCKSWTVVVFIIISNATFPQSLHFLVYFEYCCWVFVVAFYRFIYKFIKEGRLGQQFQELYGSWNIFME